MLGLHAGRLLGAIAALAGAIGMTAHLSHADAAGEERTISFFHIHTEERLTILYKRDGKYIPEALEKINWIMRDWRQNKAITIDPATIDIMWEMHAELGSKEPISIICGYRSPETNNMLRRTVGGQAKQSQHITGKAIDFTFPDISLRQMRYSALIRERGGVGYYPGSGIPFIHVDTGRVRHWPPMPSSELAMLFNGRSKHDGSVTAADAKRARDRNKDAAAQVAQYFETRNRPKTATTTLVADARDAMAPAAPKPTPAVRPAPAARAAPAPEHRMAVGAPVPPPETVQRENAPQLVAAPRVAERPALPQDAIAQTAVTQTAVARPDDAERSRLDELVKLASLDPPPAGAPAAVPATLPEPAAANLQKPTPVMASVDPMASLFGGKTAERKAEPAPVTVAALDPAVVSDVIAHAPPAVTAEPATAALPSAADGALETTANAPVPRLPALVAAEAAARAGRSSATEPVADDYDDEHPEELFYRAFSLAPLLTSSASPDEPALAALVHPDAAHAFDVLDDDGSVERVSLRQGAEVAGPTRIPAFQAATTVVADGAIKTSSR